MRGIITTRHLVTCAPVIIMEFGLSTYWRCLQSVITRSHKTFLECSVSVTTHK